MLDLTGRSAMVTGAESGVGASVAEAFATSLAKELARHLTVNALAPLAATSMYDAASEAKNTKFSRDLIRLRPAPSPAKVLPVEGGLVM